MKAIQKDFVREVKATKSRFFSILILVALAVAFLSGLRSTAPDMKGTCDSYMDTQGFMDIQVLATLGLTAEDLAFLQDQPGVASGEGAYVIDAFARSQGMDIVTKVYSLPEDINRLSLTAGRLPLAADECAVDANLLETLNLSLGERLYFATEGDFKDTLAGQSFTVVGEVVSPLYISVERGSSTLGTGRVAAYAYLPTAAFSMDFFTAAYLTVDGGAEAVAFSADYDALVDGVLEPLKLEGKTRAVLRRNALVNEANEKLADAQTELDKAKADTEKELREAEKELHQARVELDDGWQELKDAKATLLRETGDARKKLDDAQVDLADAQIKVDDGEMEYAQGVMDYEAGARTHADGLVKYYDGLEKYEDGLAEYRRGASKLDRASDLLRAADSELTAAQAELMARDLQFQQLLAAICGALASGGLEIPPEALLAALADPAVSGAVDQVLNGMSAALPAGTPDSSAALLAAKVQLDQGWAQYQGGMDSYDSGHSDYQDGRAELREAGKKLDDAKKELDEAQKKLVDGEVELADAETKLSDARIELDEGWVELNDGLIEYANGEAELTQSVADANVELADATHDLRSGEVEYNDGLIEYQDGKLEADSKIGDAEKELSDARRKVADIGDGKWYVLNRSSNPGYLGFGQDADRMGNLASLFPLLFFLVAALVCLTTMTRMVEEERVQIGGLKALGYARWTISKKYLSYALLPSLFGGLLGLAVGYTLFPKMIFTAYQIMYEVPDIQLRAYADISAFSLLAGVGCTLAATLLACLATLTDTPANLMRPHTPKPGKRVALEYIRPLWRRLRFTHKVTARNLLRYQRRFWMTVVGIGGCTALIIAGFGLRSSLLSAMDVQYDQLYRYTGQLAVSDNILPEERAAIDAYLAASPLVAASLPCHMGSVTAESAAYSLPVYLQVTGPEIRDFVDLRDTKGAPLNIPEEGVLINQKLAELLQVGVGEHFTVDGNQRAEVTVAGIFEQYLGHFLYFSPAYYEKTLGEAYVENAFLLTLRDDSAETCDSVFSQVMALPGAAAATRLLDTRDSYQHSMERIDFVVVIVILSAAALALVVLYNLSNINITERKRELATIRVLGFYDREVSAYINRENAVLTVFGIAFGMLSGHFLHLWLVKSVEIELMMFVRDTAPSAYFWAALLTASFSVMTALLAHWKMKGIDMVESLKSAE